MTEHNLYILRIELEDFENENRYAEYQSFTVADAESKYRLDKQWLLWRRRFVYKDSITIMKRKFKLS